MLTYSQDAASDHSEGHAIFRAVAGSGKTTTLIALIKKLISKGISPQKITFVVFNKKASEDIKSKLIKSGIDKSNLPKVYTFHSLALKLYAFLDKKGFAQLNRLETNDLFINKFAARILNQIKSKKEKKPAFASKEETEAFINFIDIAKSVLLPTEDAFDQWVGESRLKHFVEAFHLYEEERVNSKFITFSDLMKDVVMLCKNNPHAANSLKGHVDYLLMDEVQDINEISIETANVISEDKTNWIMVGDVSQCIYSWRGAEPNYIAYKLKELLSETKSVCEYELPETFRYGHLISLISNNIISNNNDKIESICISSESAEKTSLEIDYYKEEGRFGSAVADRIKKIHKKNNKLSDIAILIRLYSFSTEIELALLKRNIPYRLEGGSTVFEKREVSALISILELSQGTLYEHDDTSLCKKLNNILSLCFFGIKIEIKAGQLSLLRDNRGALSNLILKYDSPNLSKFKKERLYALSACLKALDKDKRSTLKPEDILNSFIKQNEVKRLVELFAVRNEDSDNKMYTINSFISFIKGINSNTEDVLSEVSHYSNRDDLSIERVIISTVHKSKGLEWKHVVVPGLEDGLFPYTKKENNVDIESERRLFYVASTRCIEGLYYICPQDRALELQVNNGRFKYPLDPVASRFVYEAKVHEAKEIVSKGISKESDAYLSSALGKSYIDKFIDLKDKSNKKFSTEKYSSIDDLKADEGDNIKHFLHGYGSIVSFDSNTLVVNFTSKGIKTVNSKEKAFQSVK
jgi:DNA helicase-2/ATP-dependent DNA helicase PcrA